MSEARAGGFFAAAMLSAAFLQLGHVPAGVALIASVAIGAAFTASLKLDKSRKT